MKNIVDKLVITAVLLLIAGMLPVSIFNLMSMDVYGMIVIGSVIAGIIYAIWRD